MTSSSEKELVVVSGASTGLGAATARELSRQGYHVLAGVRNASAAEELRADGIEPVLLDITDPAQLRDVADRVATDPRPLRALVNNAGMAANAPIEILPIETWRRMLDVNVLGPVALTQALLPALRASRGRVVLISSTGGRIAMPSFGAYSASKFAVEAIGDTLRRELRGSGVDVAVIEPGSMRTSMTERGTRAAEDLLARLDPDQLALHGTAMRVFLARVAEFGRTGVTAEHAARVVARSVTARRPRTRSTIGRDAALFTRLARIMPDRALDRALAAEDRRLLRGLRAAPAAADGVGA